VRQIARVGHQPIWLALGVTDGWLQERELPPSERLQDAERSGAPTLVWSKWLLFALACEPSNYGRAISHWTERNGG